VNDDVGYRRPQHGFHALRGRHRIAGTAAMIAA
jgi:hypothetical protein